jgi:Peptidase_C39 like family/Kelch motif
MRSVRPPAPVRTAISVLACLALLLGSAPAPALASGLTTGSRTGPLVAPAALHQTDCSGTVLCVQQRDTLTQSDKGIYDCLVASVAMALWGLRSEGVIPSPLDVSYTHVRSEMRTAWPDTGQGVPMTVAVSLVQQLTSNTAAADIVQFAADNWQGKLADQLNQGYPVIAQMGDWQLPQAGGDFNHSIVVTGIDGSSVFYIDPWDGGSHSLPVGDFGAAWQHKWKDGADAPWYAVVFTSQTALAGAPSAPTPQPQPPATTATAGWQGDGNAYQAEIWTNRGAWRSTGWMNGTIWNTQFTPNPELLWRVRGVSQSGVVGPWSMPGPVEVGTAIVPTPTVQTPKPNPPPTSSVEGVFVPTGSMGDTPGDSVTALPNGDVVVFFSHLAKGVNGSIVSSTSAEMYNQKAGKFVPAGHLIVPRVGATVAALSNGIVLVSGGSSDVSGQSPLTSAELFNPLTGTSVATGSMTAGHASGVATLLPDGRVLITGGFQEVPSSACSCFVGDSLSSAEIYDPRTGAFTPTGSMLEPRDHGAGIILPGGQVLILGGERWIPQGSIDLVTAEIFDPATGRFSATGSMATARDWPAITQLRDGKVLVAGGASFVPAGSNTLSMEPIASAELYDPKAGEFVATGSMVEGRWRAAVTLLGNGMVLVAGGENHDGDGPTLASAELYNSATGTFGTVGSMSIARSDAMAVTLPDGSALVLGGLPAYPGQYLSSAEVFR